MSTYLTGLDILGAVAVARQQLKQIKTATAQNTSAHKSLAQDVISKGQQLAQKHAKLGNAFIKYGKASARKADLAAKKRAKTVAKKSSLFKPTAATAASSAASKTAAKPTVKTVATARPSVVMANRSLIHGDSASMSEMTWSPVGPPVTAVDTGDLQTINSLLDYLNNTMGPILDQMQSGMTGTDRADWGGVSRESHLLRHQVLGALSGNLAREGEKLYTSITDALNRSADAISKVSDGAEAQGV